MHSPTHGPRSKATCIRLGQTCADSGGACHSELLALCGPDTHVSTYAPSHGGSCNNIAIRLGGNSCTSHKSKTHVTRASYRCLHLAIVAVSLPLHRCTLLHAAQLLARGTSMGHHGATQPGQGEALSPHSCTLHLQQKVQFSEIGPFQMRSGARPGNRRHSRTGCSELVLGRHVTLAAEAGAALERWSV